MKLRINARRSDGFGEDADNYSSRLVKLLPGEAFALYPALLVFAKNVAPQTISPRLELCPPVCIAFDIAGAVASWYALGILMVVRIRLTSAPRRGTQWTAVAISAITFVLWIYVVGGSFGIDFGLTAKFMGMGRRCCLRLCCWDGFW